ncbi:porin family protein [Methylotuvimicrobium alcaliphilum]|uniref:Phosphate-selective porin O and P n=1 Tax=Methylotuvimicrobium alcaliphilum (strain DSM 19304 / NCIMB 14124 / VKM B-2133 / 20Z) TaxID=1091494 RepID=G4T3H8_META2|nr:hypothetical protein [Methylotuvimicrobium alcaliphilum]CCE23700.1 conserved exported protein of unknown function [Methylotuvimicrobium alcaliphilum 20Z]
MRHTSTLNRFFKLHSYGIVLVLCCLFTNAQAFENDWLPQNLQIHGFLSQGFIHTSDNNFFGKTDDSISSDFRELGINASYRILPELQIAMQVVWRDAGKTDDSNVRIDYGVASYNLYSSEHSLLTLRGGRVPTPLGLYNDTRDVASTRPSILLPQSIYFDVNRNLALSADGGYIYGEHRTDYGDFSLNFGVVIPRLDDPDFKNVIVGSDPGKMEGDVSWVLRTGYEWENGLVKLAVTYADFNGDYKPSSGALLQPGSWRFNPLILSAQYNTEKWSLTGEYALRRAQLRNFGAIPDTEFTGQSFYIQGTYRLTSSLEALVRYDELIWDMDDRKGLKLAQAAPGITNHSRFAQDWTFGLRYEILPALNFSAEYHRINGTGWLSNLENPQGTTQHWDMYTIMMSYDF